MNPIDQLLPTSKKKKKHDPSFFFIIKARCMGLTLQRLAFFILIIFINFLFKY